MKRKTYFFIVLILLFIGLIFYNSESLFGNDATSLKPLNHDEVVSQIRAALDAKLWQDAVILSVANSEMIKDDSELISEVNYKFALNASKTLAEKIFHLLKVKKESKFYKDAVKLGNMEFKKSIEKAEKEYKVNKLSKSYTTKIKCLYSAIDILENAREWDKKDKKIMGLLKQYKTDLKFYENKLAYQKKLAAAKAAAEEAAEERAAEERAAEEAEILASYKLFSDDGGLALVSYSSGYGYIDGIIKNIGNNDYSYVQVNIKISDEEGNIIDNAMDNISGLAVGETWKFHAGVWVEGQFWYRIDSIEYY